MTGSVEHIGEIERVVGGAASTRDPVVVQSWRRCIDQYGLDPTRAQEAFILPEAELRSHRQQSEELIAIARSGLESLYAQVAGQNYVLLLGDRSGVAVEFLGDPNFDHRLRKAGLYLGAEWSEPRAGTCAIGACIATGEPLTIHQTDHFDVTHTPLSCTAAPIYDARGEFAAVVDISLLSSPIEKVSQNMALHAVAATVRRIELANLMAQTRDEWVLRFSRTPEFLDVDPEAAVSLDGSGRILGMTHGGAQILARAAGLDWRRADLILGEPVDRFFEMGVNDLADLTRRRPTRDRGVLTRDGRRLFAHAIEPQRPTRRPSRPAGPAAALERLGRDDGRIRALQARAAKLAPTPIPILIQGETGTGKEFLARALHEASGRRGAFVAVNCAAIPEALIEAELFGHAPGAFTGASPRGRKGLVEEAEGGTLFLDEIGDMPLALQARLLRVLSEGEILPVGATRPKRVQVRVLSASHRDLAALARSGGLREDLYYRLSAATLTLPPLRERADFDWLADRLLAGQGAGALLSPGARERLRAHGWPGNLRELANALAVAAALCEGGVIAPCDLPEALAARALPAPSDEAREGRELAALIAECRGNVSEAARRLGVDRTTVHRRMRRLGLAPRN